MNQQFTHYEIFPISVMETILDIDTQYYLNLLYRYKSSYPKGVKKSNSLGYQTKNTLHRLPEFYNLVNLLNQSVFNAYKKQSRIHSLWGNISIPYSYNLAHSHFPKSELSGVLYLNTPPKGGNIFFHDPLNFNNIKFLPSELNKLILFPSEAIHSVEQNLSDQDRVSLAFNFNIFED